MIRKNIFKVALTFVFAFTISTISAQIYDADFSTDGNGFPDHSTSNPPAEAPANVGPFGSSGNQWSLHYTSKPSTDASDNIFKVSGGSLISNDWGGQGIFQSQSVDISGISFIDITAATMNVGANQNKFEYFYILDGGARISTGDISSNDGDALNYNINSLDVSGATTLIVGFEFTENGGDQGYSTSSFTVSDTSPSPTGPTVTFDTATSSETETDATFNVSIPVTVSNYDSDQIDISVAVTGGSAESGDYTLNTTSLSFTADGSQNISLDINDDADTDSETVILTITETSSVTGLVTSQATHTLTITDDDILLNSLVINEILADPDLVSGDANGDGTVNTSSDEFVELYNTTGVPLDISDFKLSDAVSVRHIFPKGTIIPTEGSIVIFSSGNPTGISGLVQVASTGLLSLNNAGDTITILDASDNLVVTETYGAAGNNQSIAREPDFTGNFVDHSTIATNAVNFSPGKDNTDNIPFIKTWSGATSTDWATATNWIESSTPSTSDNVIIHSGLSNYPTVSNAITVNSVTIASGATLIATNTFSGAITYNRTLNNSNQWYFMSSPVIGEIYDNDWANTNSILSGQNLNKGISLYDNSTFDTDTDAAGSDTETGFWRYLQSDSSNGSDFKVAKGYGIIRNSAGTVSFVGNGLYTTSQNYALSTGDSNFNMVGNPFTAYLNLGEFFNDNPTTSVLVAAEIYLWNGSSYDTKTSGLNSTYKIAPGQGFFVEAAANTNLTFDIANVSHQNTETFQKNTSPEIHLFLSEGLNTRYANIYYIEGTTIGFDNGYDGKLFGGVSHSLAIYSHLVSDDQGKNYQLQSIPNADYENMVIPIGINADAGKEIIFSAEALNLPSELKVFLEDRQTNSYTRLDEANANYKITLTETLNGVGRFFLHTTAKSTLRIDAISLESISIYKTTNSNLRIVGVSQGKATVKLFNILGKEVLNTAFTSNGVKDISLPNLATGVYIVQLETEEGKLNKKITIE